jgi:hypothetical protein
MANIRTVLKNRYEAWSEARRLVEKGNAEELVEEADARFWKSLYGDNKPEDIDILEQPR